MVTEEQKARAAAAMAERNEWRREKWGQGKRSDNTFVPGEWAKAYDALIAWTLEGKNCNVPGCACEGKKPAKGYLKKSGYGNTSSPSPMHSFGEVASQIMSAEKDKTLACEVALEPKRNSGTYVRKADRQSRALAAHLAAGGATDEETLKRVMEDA